MTSETAAAKRRVPASYMSALVAGGLLWVGLSVAAVQAELRIETSASGAVIFSNIPRGGERQLPRTATSAAIDFHALIERAARASALPAGLLHAVIAVESAYQPQALSPRGAAGLMQLLPATAVELGVEDIWDPAQNIEGGARYLKQLLTTFDGDLRLALAAYNAGPGAIRKAGGRIPPFAETQHYVTRVMTHYRQQRRYDGDHADEGVSTQLWGLFPGADGSAAGEHDRRNFQPSIACRHDAADCAEVGG